MRANHCGGKELRADAHLRGCAGNHGFLHARLRQLQHYCGTLVPYYPEFLIGGTAITKQASPDRVSIGGEDPVAFQSMNWAFSKSCDRNLTTKVSSWELYKYTANAITTQPFNSINSNPAFCDAAKADMPKMARVINTDSLISPKLNSDTPGHWRQMLSEGDHPHCIPLSPLRTWGGGDVLGAGAGAQPLATAPHHPADSDEAIRHHHRQAHRRVGTYFKAYTKDTLELPMIRVCKEKLEEGAVLQILDPKGLKDQITAGLGQAAGTGEGRCQNVAYVHQAASGPHELLIQTLKEEREIHRPAKHIDQAHCNQNLSLQDKIQSNIRSERIERSKNKYLQNEFKKITICSEHPTIGMNKTRIGAQKINKPTVYHTRSASSEKSCQSNTTRITIAGGKGFLGSQVRAFHLSSGFGLIDIPRKLTLPGTTNKMSHDQSSKQLDDLLEGCQALINFIHSTHGSKPRHPDSIAAESFGQSIEVTTKISLACAGKSCTLIYPSSGGTVYGENLRIQTSEAIKWMPNNLHGWSKLCTEETLSYLHNTIGLSYIAFRISNAYGIEQLPRYGQGVVSHWIRSANNGDPLKLLSDPREAKAYIFSSDISEAIHRALVYMLSTPYPLAISVNIVSEKSTSLETKRDLVLAHFPNIEISTVGHPELSTQLPRQTSLDCTLADCLFGWRATTTIKEGISKSAEWNISL